ncbi:hypothetical protein JL721_3955 [Aureococcus anophagefferens]|nr:hypothetical protein JL721_3955 [Aureococcus anophagefferens]
MLVFAVALVAAVRCAAAPRSDALAYEADGVAVWRGVVAADEVAALRGAYDAWAANASFDGAVTVNFCSPWPTLWPGAPACDSGVAPIVEDLLRARRPRRGQSWRRRRARYPLTLAAVSVATSLPSSPAAAPARAFEPGLEVEYVLIPLGAAPADGGAWEVWPGSHRTAAVAGDGVVVATAPGDVIGLRPAVFHRRTANSFAAPRPCLVAAFVPAVHGYGSSAGPRRFDALADARDQLRVVLDFGPPRPSERYGGRRLEIAGAPRRPRAAGDPLAAFRRSPAYEALGRGVNGACALAAALAAARGDAPADLGFRAASPVAPARVFELAPSSPQLAFEIAVRVRVVASADLPLLSALQASSSPLSLGDAPAAARRAVLRRVAHFDAFWLLTAENGTATTFARARRDAAPVAEVSAAADARDCALPPPLGAAPEHAAAAVVCPSGNYGSTAVTWTERRAATSREDFEEDVVVTVGARETLPVAAAAALAPCPGPPAGRSCSRTTPLARLDRGRRARALRGVGRARAAAGGDGLGALARRHAAACLRWTRLCVSQDLAAHEPCQGVLRGAVEPQHAPCVRHGALRGADGRARASAALASCHGRVAAPFPLEGPYDAPAAPAPAVAERREAVAGVLGPGCRRLCHVGANVLSPASYWLAVTHDDVDVTLFVVPAPQGGDDDDFRVLEATARALPPGKRLEAVALNSLRALEARAVAPYRGTCDAVYVDLWNLGAAAYDRRAETRNGTCVDWAAVDGAGAPAVDFADCAEATGRNLVGLGGFLWHAVPDGALAAAEAREAAAADAADGDVARAREALGVIASAVLSAPRGPRRQALRFTVFCNHVAAKVLRRSMQRLMDMAWGRFGGEDLVVYFDATWPDRVPEAAKAHLMLFKPCATVKLFLPQILDPTIRWAVYLDTDVVFAADPAALWLGAANFRTDFCQHAAYDRTRAAPSSSTRRARPSTRKFAYAPAFGRLAFFLALTRDDDGAGCTRPRAAADFERLLDDGRAVARLPCRAIAELALSLVRAAPTR